MTGSGGKPICCGWAMQWSGSRAEEEARRHKVGPHCDEHMSATFKSFGSCPPKIIEMQDKLSERKIKT